MQHDIGQLLIESAFLPFMKVATVKKSPPLQRFEAQRRLHQSPTKRERKKMAGKFVMFKGKNGQFFFRLMAANSQVILASQGYKTRAACNNGIKSIRKNAQNPKSFEVREAKDGRQYFIIKASNGQEIGRSQMYKSASGCRNGMKSVARNSSDADLVEE